ncbi:MAG TPA: hypothetical protein VHO72_15040 [Bacteroidales bacterium]|nr:hypothetical protein [Bacteroidales bacterium]
MNRLIVFVFIVLICGITHAADGYRNKALVDSVPTKGFYKVVLSPEVISYVKRDYSDIRLMNSKHKEVPYLLVEEKSAESKQYFKEIPIVGNEPHFSPKLTRIVVENADKHILTELLFIIRNTTVEPEVIVKGSDDSKNWFFISREYLIAGGSAESDTSEIRSVQFPKNNYRYFEVTIPHKKGEVIQFIKAGYRNSEHTNGIFTQIPEPRIIQKDSARKSYITLIFKRPYVIDQLTFDIAGPDYYLRSFHTGRYAKQRNQSVYFDAWYSQTLSSTEKNTLSYENLRADTLGIEIENEDNPPLSIKSVKAFQLNKYLVAQLESGEQYEIYFNNENLTSPNYDLKYFSDVIPGTLPFLNVSHLQVIAVSDKEQSSSQFFNKQMVWIILGIVVIVLGAISIRLMNEMKRTKKTE